MPMRPMFDIRLTSERLQEPKGRANGVYGKIYLEDHYETFSTSLEYWEPREYIESWRAELRRLVDGASTAALITSYHPPRPGDFWFWWPLYRIGDIVYIQEQMLFFDQLPAPFRADRPSESLMARETITDEGARISEWQTTVTEIEAFLRRRTEPATIFRPGYFASRPSRRSVAERSRGLKAHSQ